MSARGQRRALLLGIVAVGAVSCASSASAPIAVRSNGTSVAPDSATTSTVSDSGQPASGSAPASTSTRASTSTSASGTRLSGTGIAVVADEAAAASASAPFVLTDVQARRLAAGGVMFGHELDALAPLPDGSPPMSYLLAAWIINGTSDSAAQARTQLGEQDWHHAPTIAFPAGVVAAFVGDLAATVDAEMPRVAAAPASTAPVAPPVTTVPVSANGLRLIPARADGPCSAVTNFVADVLDKLFGALRITPSTTPDDSLFGFVTSGLTTIWNFAVGLAEGFVKGLIDSITRPIFDAIRLGVSALGAATTVLSYFEQQELVVKLQPDGGPEVYHFAVGSEPAVRGSFIASGKELSADWPPAIVDCARVTGAPLPQLLAPGSPVTWKVSQIGTQVITPGELQGVVLGDHTAELTFVTGQESEEDAKGDPVTEPAVAAVSIERGEVRDFLQLASREVESGLQQLLSNAPAQVRDAAGKVYHQVVDPSLEALQKAVNGDLGVFTLRGQGTVNVLHHTPPSTTLPPTIPPPSPSPSDPGQGGSFCAQYTDLVHWVQANQPGDVVAWANEIVRRLTAMRPSAPGNLVGYVDSEITTYTDVAAQASVLVLEQDAAQLMAAANALGTACNIPTG